MTDSAKSPGDGDRPDPAAASTPAEFVGAMRRLKDWSGMAYRQLEKRAAAAGETLPRSTITAALARDVLPREDLVGAFARTCGCGEDEVEHWVTARRRIAAASAPGPAGSHTPAPDAPTAETPAPDTSTTETNTTETSTAETNTAGTNTAGTSAPGTPAADGAARRGLRGALASLVPPAIRHGDWPVRILASVLVLVVGVTVVAAVVATVRDLTGPAGSVPSDGPSDGQPGGQTDGPTDGGSASAVPAWTPPGVAQLGNPPAVPAGAANVLYIGDSIAAETRDAVTFFVQGTGKGRVVPAAHPGTAICDFLDGTIDRSMVPAEHKLPALVKAVKPRVVALQFWGNSSGNTPCTGGARPGGDDYYRRYRADAEQAVQQIAQAARETGIARPRLIWVLQGPDRASPDRVRRLNGEVLSGVANAHGDLVSDAGWHVSMAAYPYETIADGRYKWAQHLPCTDLEKQHGYCTAPQAYGGVTQLHKDSDDLHFCLGTMTGTPQACDKLSPGLIRYGRAIADTITRSLGA